MPLSQPTQVRQQSRRGTIAPFVIVSLSVLLAAFALCVNKTWLWGVREDVRVAGDAAALAAAFTLIDDDLLRDDPDLVVPILLRSANKAIEYGAGNWVRGIPFLILDNPDNDPAGDLVYGVKTTPLGTGFTPIPGRNNSSPSQAAVNTVVIQGRLTQARNNAPRLIFGVFAGNNYADIQAVSAATLDRGIVGFRPKYGSIPLAPIALRSDPSAADLRSWEYLVEQKNGPDQYEFNRQQQTLVNNPLGDLIHEFAAVLATDDTQLPQSNVALIHLSSIDLFELAYRLEFGVDKETLAQFDGRFALPEGGGTLDVPGQDVGPNGSSPEIQYLAQTLMQLRDTNAVRIWPLYTSFNELQGIGRISGFVAARVASVTPPQHDQPLQFTLQATTISAPYAVTDTERNGPAATLNSNRYIAKLRRIE